MDAEDLRTLIGILAVAEGVIWGEADGDLSEFLRQHWTQSGLLAADADRYEVRQVLNDLNQRVRYALGEYDEPPTSVPLPP